MGRQGGCTSQYGLEPIEEQYYGGTRKRSPLFSEQDIYEVVELTV